MPPVFKREGGESKEEAGRAPGPAQEPCQGEGFYFSAIGHKEYILCMQAQWQEKFELAKQSSRRYELNITQAS